MRKSSVVLCGAAAVGAVAVLLVPGTVPEVSHGDTSVTSVTVNDGRTIVLGPAETVTFPVVVRASDDSGIRSVGPIGVWGPNYGVLKVSPMQCSALSGTASECRGTVTVDSSKRQISDEQAGSWFVDLTVRANDGDQYVAKTAGGFSLKHASRLSGSGVPAQAAPGQRLEVKGQLDRTSWDAQQYHGQSSMVFLQFRAGGSQRWTTVANTWTDAAGTASVTVDTTESGSYQWYSPGDKWAIDTVSPELPVTVGR